jgi:hypothetical protein
VFASHSGPVKRKADGPRWHPVCHTPPMGLNDDYTSGSYRSLLLMVIGIPLVIALIWLAYGWALGQPGVPPAP